MVNFECGTTITHEETPALMGNGIGMSRNTKLGELPGCN